MTNPWTQYWQQGHSTTFGDYFKGGYEGPIGTWWKNTLTGIDTGATVIEIGCGNCSLLPELVRSQRASKYVGVDLATVKLSDVAKTALDKSDIDVIIHSETPAERIPEADQSADLVASVFGIEYTDLESSVPEVFRLLKAGGKFVGLLHHHNSIVTTMSRRALNEFVWDDIIRVLNALMVISTELEQVAGDRSRLKQSYNAEVARQCVNQMADKYLSNTDPDTANIIMFEFMTAALKFFAGLAQPLELRSRFINTLRVEYEASEARFNQMVSVALDEPGIAAFQALLAARGGTACHSDVVKFNDDILAWQICIEK